jgi:hypothetical protein
VKTILSLSLSLLLAIPLQAQIATGSYKDCGNNGGSGTLTCSFTNTAGNTIIFCGVGDSTGGADDAQVPQYNGVSAVLTDHQNPLAASNNRIIYTYILPSAATGTHNVTWTSSTNHFLIMGVGSYQSAATTAQPDNHSATTNNTNGTPFNSSLTTNADNSWVVVCVAGLTAAVSTGLTARTNDGSFGTWALGDSNGVVHPAGSFSFTTTGSGGAYILDDNVSIKPPSSAVAPKKITVLGIGD